MSSRRPYSQIEMIAIQWQKELNQEKEHRKALLDYEEGYRGACGKLQELARGTMAVWEPAYKDLRMCVEQGIQDGLLSNALEQLEIFLLRSKAALTEYRREKGKAAVTYYKPLVDITKYGKKSESRAEVALQVKETQARVSELINETNREASGTLEYLRDIHAEAKDMYETLQRKVERAYTILALEEPKELLEAIHFKLVQAGKVSMVFHDFARLLAEGRGSFTFSGKQNELAYLLLFLDRNGLANNWKELALFYEKSGVPVKVTAKNIIEAQKKLGSRNDPGVKGLLAGLKRTFDSLTIP